MEMLCQPCCSVLSILLDKSAYEYRFKGRTAINHVLYMDDIKLNVKNELDIDSLIHLTRVFSSDIGIAFGLAKCIRFIVNRGKVKSTSGISLPEGQIDNTDESYKHLGILQSFGNNEKEVICMATFEYRNQVRRVLMSKLSSKNKGTAIHTFAVPVICYPAEVVNWRRGDLKKANIGTRKLMIMLGVFQRREEQSLKSYVSTKAESDLLMDECKHRIAT